MGSIATDSWQRGGRSVPHAAGSGERGSPGPPPPRKATQNQAGRRQGQEPLLFAAAIAPLGCAFWLPVVAFHPRGANNQVAAKTPINSAPAVQKEGEGRGTGCQEGQEPGRLQPGTRRAPGGSQLPPRRGTDAIPGPGGGRPRGFGPNASELGLHSPLDCISSSF